MLPPFDSAPLILMVSGGSDSVAAARMLPQLLPQRRLVILHINHKLRGEDADTDERFVIELARGLGLPCETRQIDVAALAAASGANIEQTGREARYVAAEELLDELCLKAGVDAAYGRIVTAHTLDDRVETFFMRVIRGAGAGALSSIPYRRGRVIRPLLDCTRQQLREWLMDRGGEGDCALWCEDETNSDTSRLRAFVRHELIPLAQTRNPELLQTVANSLDNLACDNELLSDVTDELERCYVVWVDDATCLVKIDGALFDEDQALVRRLIQRVCKRLLPPDKRITSEHIITIAEQGNHVGFVTVICGAVTVANEYGTLVFYRDKEPVAGGEGSQIASLEEGHQEVLPDGRIIELVRVAPESFSDDPVAFVRANASDTRAFIDEAKVFQAEGALKLSRVGHGDRFCPMGMGGHHRLVFDVFIDRKIPRRLRSAMCKLSVGIDRGMGIQDEIVWVIGVQLDDRFKVSETTTSMLSIIVRAPEAL